MGLWKGRRAQTFVFEAFGVRVALDVAEPELDAAVADRLPGGWRRQDGAGETVDRFELTRSGQDGYRIGVEGSPGSTHATLEVALGMLETGVEQVIARNALEWVFVHAGAVSSGGRALLLPGESFSGKTTLVAALLEAGATYYSDEYAVLDREGRLHAYPRRLSLRTSDGQPWEQLHTRDLSGLEARQTAEVAVVAFTHYRPGASWRPKRISPARGVVALLTSTLTARERPVESMQTLRRATSGSILVQGKRGEAGPAAAALVEMLKG